MAHCGLLKNFYKLLLKPKVAVFSRLIHQVSGTIGAIDLSAFLDLEIALVACFLMRATIAIS